MRAVALDAVTNRRGVYSSLQVSCIHLSVAAKAERLGRSGGEFDSGYVLIDANFMTTRAPGHHCSVHDLTFILVLVALDAFGGLGVFVERNRMNSREQGARTQQGRHRDHD